jgi:hypothetical protein
MISNASEFGCSSTDSSCLCSVDDVLNGIRICVIQTCGSDTALDALSSWEREFCGRQYQYLIVRTIIAEDITESVISIKTVTSTTSSNLRYTLESVERSSTRSLSPLPSSPTSSPSAAPSTLGSLSKSSSGLSNSAKIGLAAGIPCGLFAIAAGVGLYILWKYKARKKSNLSHKLDMPENKADEYSGSYEMDGWEVQQRELETNANRVELPETGVKQRL